MKMLRSISEVKEHFDFVKVTERVQVCYKAAYRKIPGLPLDDKKRVPYPVLLPTEGTNCSEYLKDLEQLGYNTIQILKQGIVLYFNGFYVPNDLAVKKVKGKNPTEGFTAQFQVSFIKGFETIEELQAGLVNFPTLLKQAWNEQDITQITPEFCYIDDKLAKELNDQTDAVFALLEI